MIESSFSRHTIADIRDWKKDHKLEIQPDFQRRDVWNPPARIMLIDSILQKIPLPKIFIGTVIRSGSTHRIVIDGQQRITSILEFIGNKFSLDPPYEGPHAGKHFKDLDEKIQNQILSYNLDFNEFQNYTDAEIRNIYHRVNKYTTALSKQELRRADFPGDFLDLAEKLSIIEYFDDAKLFTLASRRRLGDVEYISELLAILIDGIQDKKESLDNFYIKFESWKSKAKEQCENRFLEIIKNIQVIFDEKTFPIKQTRFRQKSDFYSLFAAINELHIENKNINKKSIDMLTKDLIFLDSDSGIEPGAPGLLGEYAVRCISDANSLNSRKWRTNFIKNFLYGAYNPLVNPSKDRVKFFRSFIGDDSGMCPGAVASCEICGREVHEYDKDAEWCFPRKSLFLENARLAHLTCLKGKNSSFIFVDEN